MEREDEPQAALKNEVRLPALDAEVDEPMSGEGRDDPVERIIRAADTDQEVRRERRQRDCKSEIDADVSEFAETERQGREGKVVGNGELAVREGDVQACADASG